MSRICRESGGPIFITENGQADLVLMSVAAYEQLQAQLEVYRALANVEGDVRAGDRGISVAAMRRKLGR